mmetsp:Transcript_20037/g.59713  ORF Transcript_20037/g.59713 Transcript_20037/m.59713 type:complete len:222 (+) Transcript_20037:271-936(+)
MRHTLLLLLAPSAGFFLQTPRVRRATAADLDELAVVRMESTPLAQTYRYLVQEEGTPLRDLFCKGLDTGAAVCYLAEDRGEIVGYCDVTTRKALGPGLADHAYIKNLCVVEGHRKKGLGAALVKACERHANQNYRDYEYLALEVDDFNGPAYRLYERLGFNETVASLGALPALWRYGTFFLGRSLMRRGGVASPRGAFVPRRAYRRDIRHRYKRNAPPKPR